MRPNMPGASIARALALAALMALACRGRAEEYMDRDRFLALAFASTEPEMKTLWLNAAARSAAEDAVGWAPQALRLRYWHADGRTAWILEDVGKEQPITDVRVLAHTPVEGDPPIDHLVVAVDQQGPEGRVRSTASASNSA